MTRKRAFLLGGMCFVLFGCGIVSYFVFEDRKERRRQENVDKIKLSMSRTEVVALIGEPNYAPGKAPSNNEAGAWSGSLGWLSMETEGWVWQFSDVRCVVRFDENIVTGIMTSPGVKRESPLDKFLHLLR